MTSITPNPKQSLASQAAKDLFKKHGVKMTLGGEPTFLPLDPSGPEWSITAVGPTKLDCAFRMAGHLVNDFLPGAMTLFSPGKLYPGEVNPRWAVNILWRADGKPIRVAKTDRAKGKPTPATLNKLAEKVAARLGLAASSWIDARDPNQAERPVKILPLDHEKKKWVTDTWKWKSRGRLPLLAAEGPAGLRLPLHELQEDALRRAMTLELCGKELRLFLPPLTQAAFAELVEIWMEELESEGLRDFQFQGYVPSDSGDSWKRLGLAADPGVLEINLPPCADWEEYDYWMKVLEVAGEKSGMRSYKVNADGEEHGTGGGNHLLFGGPSLDENPFFPRPWWVASLARYFQRHPALAYLFTGIYVGPSSQAPRPDESARDLYDLDMAYQFLETLPEGDHRYLIGETLRHLHTDVTGNSHRAETSFDKFWSTNSPGGCLGLIEFRAIESLPKAEWMSAIALLWKCIGAHTLANREPGPLDHPGDRLHDCFFLPAFLWEDLQRVLGDLAKSGMQLDREIYREIWTWRFPSLLEWQPNDEESLSVRRACEGWPLLSETPLQGGSTSRFVDTSIARLEFRVSAAFDEKYRVFVQGREVVLQPFPAKEKGAGLRYRRTSLYPSLHPGIPPHLPLELAIHHRETGRRVKLWHLVLETPNFEPVTKALHGKKKAPCRKSNETLLTYDLRLA